MIYHPDDFLALNEEIERQGGYVQPDECLGEEYRIKQPSSDGMVWKRFQTTNCGFHARFGVTYDPTAPVRLETAAYDDKGKHLYDVLIEHPGEKVDGATYAAVCAVDDNLGRWPRFQHVIEEDSH